MYKKINNTYFVKDIKDLYGIDSEDGKRSIVDNLYASESKICIGTNNYIYPLPKLDLEQIVKELNSFGFNIRIAKEKFDLEDFIFCNFRKVDWERDDTAHQRLLVKGGNNDMWELLDSYDCYWQVPNTCYIELINDNKENEILNKLNEENVTVKDLCAVYYELNWI